jgi:hypothetical protein
MACAVRRLFESTDVKKTKIFVMAAHDGGLVTFGKDLQEAFGILMRSDEQGRRKKLIRLRGKAPARQGS